MDVQVILDLVKDSKGIRASTSRDTFITAIINSVITELTDEKGLTINAGNMNHTMFVVDYCVWRYDSRDSKEVMPRHLQFRLHNIMIHDIQALQVNSLEIVSVLPDIPLANVVYCLPDGIKQMYLGEVWTIVDMLNGIWAVV